MLFNLVFVLVTWVALQFDLQLIRRYCCDRRGASSGVCTTSAAGRPAAAGAGAGTGGAVERSPARGAFWVRRVARLQ